MSITGNYSFKFSLFVYIRFKILKKGFFIGGVANMISAAITADLGEYLKRLNEEILF
jgi:hypothetical protein